MPQGNGQVNLSEIRLKLTEATGKRYWRSLDELADTPDFQELLHREFPERASEWLDGMSRRKFLALAAASLAIAGVGSGGCARAPQDRIVPYVRPSANLVPGKPLYFATAMPFRGVGMGVVATSREGRPVKIEGNADHPESQGATNIFMQASVLNLWDPDRSHDVLYRGQPTDWAKFESEMARHLATKQASKGAGIRILTRSTSSPTLIAAIEDFLKTYSEAKWHHYDPVSRDSVRGGTQLAFGQRLDAIYDFSKADVVLTLDSDFLFAEPGSLRYARQFIDRRRMRLVDKDDRKVDPKSLTMNRLYAVESFPTLAGSMSDHRLVLKPSEIAVCAAAIASAVGAQAQVTTNASPAIAAWANKVAKDLKENKEKGKYSIVVAGDQQPAEVHALAFAINAALGNLGQTVSFIDPVVAHPDDSLDSLTSLIKDVRASKVDTLFIIGANPAYDTPGEMDFLSVLKQVPLRIHLGEYVDETAFECHWHLPEAHYLEAWGDLRAYDGTVSIVQPLIAPLYTGKSALEVFSILNGHPEISGYELVRRHWLDQHKSGDFEGWWRTTLEKGVVADSAAKPKETTLASGLAIKLPATPATAGTLEVSFLPDPTVWDGCYANNGWLQELPKPLTHLTWDNAVYVGAKTAENEKLEEGDLVAVNLNGREVWGAIFIMPGMPEGSATLHLGYGRERAGRLGGNEHDGVGFNFYKVRNVGKSSIASGLKLRKVNEKYNLVTTRAHNGIWDRKLPLIKEPLVIARPEERKDGKGNSMTHDDAERDLTNRRLVRVATLEEFQKDPLFAKKMDEEEGERIVEGKGEATPEKNAKGEKKTLSLEIFPDYDYTTATGNKEQKHRWAMSIDINACIGCSACVIACQSENNIPVVGKEQVDASREMHWIRIDTYYAGDIENPETYFEPVPCMQCETAPCELVCPVAATVHDDEGINNMVYNRCVGTRYCSNNCPYKVRRFNFLHYSSVLTESERLGTNPEVTIRTRGVMEKCTYCIQRINNTRIEMEKVQVRLEEQMKKSRDDKDRGQLREQMVSTKKRLLDNLETACQQSCPTEAIAFGDLNDPTSHIFRLKQEPHDYGLLAELATKPRTTYLARVRNPNPDMETTAQAHEKFG